MQLIRTDGVKILIYNFERRNFVTELLPSQIPYYDLTLCVEGEMHYIYEGNRIVLHSGDAILFPQGSVRERLASGIPCLYASFNIQLDKYQEPLVCGYLPRCITPSTVAILEEMKKEFSSFSPLKNEKFLSLFSYVYNSVCERSYDSDDERIRQIKNYICMNLTEKLTLESIASHVHLAPQYVCTVFKKQTGITITRFIMNQRIGLAKIRIITSQESISEIAEECGFNDYCYFSHAFKKITGVSANQYRKMTRQ